MPSPKEIKCPKCNYPMFEDPMFESGAVMLVTGTGKDLVEDGLDKETRMCCDNCRHVEYIKVGKMPPLSAGKRDVVGN